MDLVVGFLATLGGVVNSLVECSLRGINELGEGILEFSDGLVLRRKLVEDGLCAVLLGLDGNLIGNLLVWDDEGSGEGRERQNVDEFHG